MAGDAVVQAELDALEILAQDEVDHAADGVGAVHGGGAFGQHVDAVDHVRRQHVDVRVDHALAVHQHQRAIDAQAAQRDARGAAAGFQQRAGDAAAVAVVGGVGGVAGDRRHVLQHVAQGGLAGVGDGLAVDGHHRAGGLHVHAADQRAGDHHGVQRLGFVLGGRRGLIRRGLIRRGRIGGRLGLQPAGDREHPGGQSETHSQ